MKFRSSSCRLLASIALVPLTLVACSAGNNSASGGGSKPAGTSAASGDAVVLGSSLSLTGPLGQFGVNLKPDTTRRFPK